MTDSVQLFPARQAAALPQTTTTEAAVARAAQEVQAAMVVAKRFPRDETAAFNRIMQACKRKTLAEGACYAYPRGGQTVTGPSIRLAETLAQNWGNIDFGVVELDQRNGESQVMAYAWDLETNTRQTKVFTVKHERRVRKENVMLDDPRDIYEMVANNGARRLRACILGVIPGDVVDAAVAECESTLKSGAKEPLIDRVRKMVAAFSEMGVTQPMLEGRLGHNLDAANETELVNLRKIYASIRDGMSGRDDWFKQPTAGPKFDAPKPDSDDVPMNFPSPEGTPAPEGQTKAVSDQADSSASSPEHPARAVKSVNYLKGVKSLLKMSRHSDVDLVSYLHAKGKCDDSLGTLTDIHEVAPAALEFAYNNWAQIDKELGAGK
jgi:hypothetical protein